MSTLALRNYGLVLPSNYVSIEKDEMEYIDGGFQMKTSTAIYALEAIVAIVTLGFGIGKSIKDFVANYSKVTGKARIVKIVTKFGLAKEIGEKIAGTVLTLLGLSIPVAICHALDFYDKDGFNGYITF